MTYIEHWILGGSYSLYLRGLLHRKINDIDVCGIPYQDRLYKFCKVLGIKLDFCNPHLHEYDEIVHKGRKIKIAKLKDVLYFKYLMQKRIDNSPHTIGVKHYKDIVNVFHNLGENESKSLIDKMDLSEEDKNVLRNWMQIGINNIKEI